MSARTETQSPPKGAARKRQLAQMRAKYPVAAAQMDIEDAETRGNRAADRPRTDIGVADQYTTRKATATAHALRWGRAETDFHGREVALTIEVETKTLATPDSDVFIKCSAHSYDARPRTIAIEDAQLGDLPLLVLALQEAIRIGVEQCAFPDTLDEMDPLDPRRSDGGGIRGGSGREGKSSGRT